MSVRTRKVKKSVKIISWGGTFFLLLLISCQFFISCEKKKSSGQNSVSEQKPILLGFSQIGAESEWRIRNTQSILEAAEENGIQILYENAQQKQENQIQAIHSFIIYQVDVIAFVPIVESGWDNVLREAKEAGIPVIIVDRNIQTSDPTLYDGLIGEDTNEEGRKAAYFLLKKYKDNPGPLNILELSGTENSSAAYERAAGFRTVLNYHPRFQIIHSESGDFMKSRAHEITNKIITYNGGLKIGHKNVDIILSHNDAMTFGMLEAMEENNIDPRNFTIITFDGEKKVIQSLKEGIINCVVECNPNLGPELCYLVKKLAAGESIPRITYVNEKVYSEFDSPEQLEGKGF